MPNFFFGQDREQEINLEWPKRYWSHFKALVTYFEPLHVDQSEQNNNIHMYILSLSGSKNNAITIVEH